MWTPLPITFLLLDFVTVTTFPYSNGVIVGVPVAECIWKALSSYLNARSVWVCFSWFRLSPFVPIQIILSANAYSDISDNRVLPAGW